MVMLYMQKDGTMGPQNPVNLTNQNSTVALANRGGSLQNQARRDLQSSGQQASTPKEEKPGTGANRGAVGSLGTSSGIGTAGTSQAGLVGSVNTEVQNDDVLLPYQKGNI
ncbi:hypothetical protein MEP402_gp67 [Methylophilales phage MEP402]|nr:hypothetical protein MEP402_gp67 [Methylophilales phage MEP402]